jgi:hypothetical protein
MPVEHGAALLFDGLANLRAQLRQPAHVAAAVGDHFLFARALTTLVQNLEQDHAEHRDAVEPARHIHQRAGIARADQQRHATGAGQHGQDHQHACPALARRARVFRRWIEHQITGRQLRRRLPNRPPDYDRSQDRNLPSACGASVELPRQPSVAPRRILSQPVSGCDLEGRK